MKLPTVHLLNTKYSAPVLPTQRLCRYIWRLSRPPWKLYQQKATSDKSSNFFLSLLLDYCVDKAVLQFTLQPISRELSTARAVIVSSPLTQRLRGQSDQIAAKYQSFVFPGKILVLCIPAKIVPLPELHNMRMRSLFTYYANQLITSSSDFWES